MFRKLSINRFRLRVFWLLVIAAVLINLLQTRTLGSSPPAISELSHAGDASAGGAAAPDVEVSPDLLLTAAKDLVLPRSAETFLPRSGLPNHPRATEIGIAHLTRPPPSPRFS